MTHIFHSPLFKLYKLFIKSIDQQRQKKELMNLNGFLEIDSIPFSNKSFRGRKLVQVHL